MKEKNEKEGHSNLTSKDLNRPKRHAKTEDDAYIQINRTSFQQNFKVLLGHYKDEGHPSRVG